MRSTWWWCLFVHESSNGFLWFHKLVVNLGHHRMQCNAQGYWCLFSSGGWDLPFMWDRTNIIYDLSVTRPHEFYSFRSPYSCSSWISNWVKPGFPTSFQPSRLHELTAGKVLELPNLNSSIHRSLCYNHFRGRTIILSLRGSYSCILGRVLPHLDSTRSLLLTVRKDFQHSFH